MNKTCLFSSKFNRITFNEVSVWLCVSAAEWAELRPAGAEGRSLEDGVFRGLEQPVGTLRLQTAGILQVLMWYWPTSTDLDRPARFRTLCGIKSCDHKNNKNTMLFVRTSAVWPSAVCSVCQVRGVVLRRSDLHRAGPPVQPGVPEPQPITDHQAPERHQLQVGRRHTCIWTESELTIMMFCNTDPVTVHSLDSNITFSNGSDSWWFTDKHVADIKFIQLNPRDRTQPQVWWLFFPRRPQGATTSPFQTPQPSTKWKWSFFWSIDEDWTK